MHGGMTTSAQRVDGLRARADELGVGAPTPRSCAPAPRYPATSNDVLVTQAVARAQAGDPEAVRFLYLRYANNVFRYVRTIVHDDDDAEDITQHVFAKLITVIPRYELRACPFTAWMLRLAHNVAIDHLRSSRATPAGEFYGAEDEQAEDARDDRARDVRIALETLPAQQREVVWLRHVVGLSPFEIAQRMGRTEASIHGLHHRGRRALQDELRRLDRGPSTRRRIAA
jgi:RNA polymerase sigma-70 factor, ECF subfamily